MFCSCRFVLFGLLTADAPDADDTHGVRPGRKVAFGVWRLAPRFVVTSTAALGAWGGVEGSGEGGC